MIVSILIVFVACGLLFAFTSRLSNRALVLTPFLIFGVTEMRTTWGATVVEANATGDISPALLMVGCFLAFIIAFLVGCAILRLKKDEARAFRGTPIASDVPTKRYDIAVLIMAGVLVILGTYLYRGPPPILESLDAVFSPGSNPDAVVSINVTRKDLTKGYVFGEAAYRGQGVLTAVLERGWAYLSIFSIAAYFLKASRLRRARPVRLLWQPVAVTLIGLSYVGGTGVRAPIVMLVVAALVGLSLMVRFSKRSIAGAVGAVAVVIFLIAPLGGELATRSTAQERASSVASRVFLGNGSNNILIMRVVEGGELPQGWGSLHGEQLQAAVPGVSGNRPFTNRLNSLRGGNVAETSFASPTYFGILYADFGAIGTLAGYGLMGAIMAFSHRWLFRRRKDVASIAMVGSITLVVSQMSISGFVGLGVGILVVGILHFLMSRLVLFEPRVRLGRTSHPGRAVPALGRPLQTKPQTTQWSQQPGR